MRDVEVEGRRVDVRIENGRIAALGPGLEADAGARVIEGRGGALLPGLHDHHLHLLAWAAALASLPCGPPDVRDERALGAALRAAAGAAAASCAASATTSRSPATSTARASTPGCRARRCASSTAAARSGC